MKDKRIQKFKDHFTILCNGKRVKILNYKLEAELDNKLILVVITKIPNRLLSEKTIYFDIDDEKQPIHCFCKWFCEYIQPGLRKYYYYIQNTDA